MTVGRKILRWLAGGRTVSDLAEWLGLSKRELRRIPRDYRQFTIPKRSGGRRTIVAPNDRLKATQRRMLRRLLTGLPVHPSARGFERGCSIVENAMPHVGQAVVVNLDIIEFFASTSAKRVYAMLRRCGWGRGASRIVTRLCTHEGCLPAGAPTSPRLANLLNRKMDEELSDLAAALDARYTRYADDLMFSFAIDDAHAVRSVIWNTRRILWPRGYVLHHRRKLSIRRRHQRQTVTGLVVNSRPQLPRSVRRWLRAVQHRHTTGGHITLTSEQLAGWQSLERMLECRGRDTNPAEPYPSR